MCIEKEYIWEKWYLIVCIVESQACLFGSPKSKCGSYLTHFCIFRDYFSVRVQQSHKFWSEECYTAYKVVSKYYPNLKRKMAFVVIKIVPLGKIQKLFGEKKYSPPPSLLLQFQYWILFLISVLFLHHSNDNLSNSTIKVFVAKSKIRPTDIIS